MRLKCVNDGLVITKLSKFYLLFYKHFRNFEFWGLKKQLFQNKSCQNVWLSRGFYKNGNFSSYYEFQPITTKLIEKIAYIPFFNFYFRHFLKFWLLNLQNSNSLILHLFQKVILALYRVFCKMYTKTQLKTTVSRGQFRGRVEESKNTGWCSKKMTYFGF